jgi:RHS repeat-associated protein
VKTIYNYGNDPLNRLQSVTYNTAGVPTSEQAVAASPTVTCTYMTTGDLTRLDTLTTQGVSTENFDYDTAGRLSTHTLTLTSRASYPLATDYIYDSLNRVKDMRYPAQYGVLNNPRKLVHHDYDVASRLLAVKVDGASYATGITYNAASQATSVKVGAANANQLTENYEYDDKTGLLTNQSVVRGATTTTPTNLLDLSYSYLRAGTTAGRTGQLTKITNNLDTSGKEDRAYTYDPLGRLMKASGGASTTTPLWTQTYAYDRYGNRTTVTATGTASDGSTMPRDGLTGLSYSAATNRIVGFTYDSAGNETRAKRADGSWQQYEYDAAGRLYKIKNDAGVTLATYKYGATNQRLIVYNGDTTSANKTYYAWSDGEVIAEYAEDAATPTTPQWTKSNVYLGNRLLATIEPNGAGQFVQYHHPDRLGTRLLTNASNTTVQEQVGLPYGTALEAESTGASSRRFTSYERNAVTQLDYAINRHYDSGQGRFTQVDPIGMSAVSLTDPQSLNMYAYVGNDPVNRVDPNGLFWGKLWRAIKNIFKWLAVAAAIAVAVLTIVHTGFGSLQAILSIINAVANAAAKLLDALGLKTAAAIVGIIGAAADFLKSFKDMLDILKDKLKDVGEKVKSILTTISKGFTVASKVLSQVGHAKLAQVFELVSSATAFVSNGLKKVKGKYKFSPGSWDVYKFTRQTAEQIANIAGAQRIAGFFKAIGLIEDGVGLYNFFRNGDAEDILTLFEKNRSVQERLDAADKLQKFIGTVNSIFDRAEAGAALDR